eukprot:TRINITY_DN1408_c0_g1_i2.p1 TRINITY_DN1408_c0_g1~~TRINITY_DN1408_c0_g1_i2.p1  ORF type:complete len:738 (-),score=108.56 TRINITY_DN1408_c0_g1_i2:1374-3587(-)
MVGNFVVVGSLLNYFSDYTCGRGCAGVFFRTLLRNRFFGVSKVEDGLSVFERAMSISYFFIRQIIYVRTFFTSRCRSSQSLIDYGKSQVVFRFSEQFLYTHKIIGILSRCRIYYILADALQIFKQHWHLCFQWLIRIKVYNNNFKQIDTYFILSLFSSRITAESKSLFCCFQFSQVQSQFEVAASMQQQAVLAPCAVLVGVLIGVKLLFGRRKQSRHNKKQQQKNRDLDVEDILSFKSGQQQKPQVEAYEAPKTTAESLSKEYTFQETLVAPEDISKGISPDDVHTDYEHINDHVFVEFNIVDDDYVYVLTHQTDIPPPELHLSASSSYLQDQSASPADKVAVSYVIDSDNQVQVLINNKVENKRGVSFEKSVNVAQIACTEGLRSKDVQANMDQTDYLVGVFFNIREDDYVALVLIDMQNKQVQQIEEGEADSMFVETSSQTTQFSIPEAVPVLPEKGSEQETIEEVPAFYTDKENIKPSSAREAAAAVETLERVPHVPDSSFDDDDENKAFNQNRAQVVPASQDFDSDIILEKAEAQQTGNQDNVSGQQQTQGQELQVNSAREISAQLQKQEQSIEVPVDVIEDSAAGGQGDTSEPKTENQIEGEDAQAEQEELGECEKRAQEIVGMANQLWGKGTPVEIKRAIKMQRAALDTLQEGGGRPVYVAQVASSLADMQYALNDLQETRDTLQIALTAATETGDMAHMSKLSNNLGQVLRKLNNFEAAKKVTFRVLRNI